MRAARFDLAVQMHGSGGVTNEIVAAFGARAAIGHGSDADRGMTAVLPWVEEEREVRRWLRLVGLAGAETNETGIVFPIGDEDRQRADELLARLTESSGPLVALHAGAKDPARRWPAERFAELGDCLALRSGARIVLTGSAGERALTSAVAARMRAPALDVAGETDLGALAAVIERLDLLVTNDTGASHVAAATRTPSVIVCGPSRPSRWAPLDDELHVPVDAREVVDPALDLAEALRLLPVEPVLAACERQLASSRQAGLALTEVVA
jgi:ADP-heptose:LPS heptosyltransferase